jgi:hypothetical protein
MNRFKKGWRRPVEKAQPFTSHKQKSSPAKPERAESFSKFSAATPPVNVYSAETK